MSKKLFGGRLISIRATKPDVSTPISLNGPIRFLSIVHQPLAVGPIVRHHPHRAGAIVHVGEQRIAGLAQELDARLRGLGVAPHQDRLGALARELLERLAVAHEQARMASGHDHDDAVDLRRAGDEPRELRIAALVHGLRRHVDRVLRGAVGGQMRVDQGPRRGVELRHVETRSAQASATQAPPPPEDVQMPTRLPAGRRVPMARNAAAISTISSRSLALDHAVAREQRAVVVVGAGARRGVRAQPRGCRLPIARAC